MRHVITNRLNSKRAHNLKVLKRLVSIRMVSNNNHCILPSGKFILLLFLFFFFFLFIPRDLLFETKTANLTYVKIITYFEASIPIILQKCGPLNEAILLLQYWYEYSETVHIHPVNNAISIFNVRHRKETEPH